MSRSHPFRRTSLSQSRLGLTLIELLVVMAIIATLLSMIMPAVQSVREASRRTVCLNNIRQLALASHVYESARNELPPGILASPIPGQTIGFNPPQPGINKPNYIGTKVFLLPFLDMGGLDGSFATNRSVETGDLDAWWKFPEPKGAQILETATYKISNFLCPTDRGHKHAESLYLFVHANGNRIRRGRSIGLEFLARTNYMSCAGSTDDTNQNSGIFYNRSKVTFGHIQDGTSNVIAFGETASNTFSRRGDPADYSWVCDGMPTTWGFANQEGGEYYQYKSKHRGGLISVAMADGSCRWITPNTELTTIHRLSGKSDDMQANDPVGF